MPTSRERKEAYRQVCASTILLIKTYIKAGYGSSDIFKNFNVTQKEAEIFYIDFSYNPSVGMVDLGHKNVPYYTEEVIDKPSYSIDDLTGDEYEIAKQNINPGKLWTWEE